MDDKKNINFNGSDQLVGETEQETEATKTVVEGKGECMKAYEGRDRS